MSEPTEITETAVNAAADAAVTAISAAASMSELKAVRSAHVGETSVLARFNAGLKDVAQGERANAGRLVGQGRARVQDALSAREGELAVAEETQRLAEEAVDVTAVPSR